MLTINKDASLTHAEAVLQCMLWHRNDGSDIPGEVDIMVRSATLGGYSALLFQYDNVSSNRLAWVKQNKVSDGIDVVLACRADGTYSYDEKRGPVPTDSATVIGFNYDQHMAAAKCVYDYLVAEAISASKCTNVY